MSNTTGNYSIYAQSMNGIITLSDGVIQITNGDITNVTTIDANTITGNQGNFDNVVLKENIDISGNLTVEGDCEIRGILILDNPVTFTNATVEDLLVNNKIGVGGEFISSNDIKTCSNVICKNITINGDVECMGDFRTKNQPAFLLCDLGVPILKTISNTQLVYNNLNLQTFFGNTGNNRNILVYPFYKIVFRGDAGVIRVIIDNTNSTDLLYQTVAYPSGGLCVSITVHYKNIVIM